LNRELKFELVDGELGPDVPGRTSVARGLLDISPPNQPLEADRVVVLPYLAVG